MTTVTGLGSWPGVRLDEAFDQVRQGFPDTCYLPELPARGPGAAMIGRTLGLIDTLGFEASGPNWLTAAHPGRDGRQARQLLEDDLEQVGEALAGSTPGRFKVSLTGPWTLAAAVGYGQGEKLVSDAGACRDLSQAWCQAVADWQSRLDHLLPGWVVSLQVDEPLLPAVQAGRVSNLSGLSRYRPVEPPSLVAAYQGLAAGWLSAGAADQAELVVHCCAAGLDIALMAEAGFTTLSLDQQLLSARSIDQLAAWCSRGNRLWLGIIPTDQPAAALPAVKVLTRRLQQLAADLSLDPAASALTLTPACGLAGHTVTAALAVAKCLQQVAEAFDESQES